MTRNEIENLENGDILFNKISESRHIFFGFTSKSKHPNCVFQTDAGVGNSIFCFESVMKNFKKYIG